ncbi:MAG: ThiF family adenylyltransferase, partial [Candidatus Omnitrophica bacterium]|nr:ThiF family adenylyltransferase [Candidatus Omnitrophota bacterium]
MEKEPDLNNETEFRNSFLNRSLPFLTPEGADILKGKAIAIAGCGGVGGIMAVTFARLGIGNFHLADP